jgi:hypothetical protein
MMGTTPSSTIVAPWFTTWRVEINGDLNADEALQVKEATTG